MCLAREYLYNLVTGKIKGPIAVILRAFLCVLSFAYGAVVIILAAYYRIKPKRLGAKVISVGNITLGGTGKTTFVEYLSGLLSAQGAKVAVLSRGYRRNAAKLGAGSIGDEPAMLRKKLPSVGVVVDKNRIKAAFKAIKDYAAQILILDDGFQQWRISKDLEIVMIDAANPFGNYRLLPAGLLREPLLALKRADIFVLAQAGFTQDTAELTDRLQHLNSKALIVESIHQPDGFSGVFDPNESLGTDALKGRKVLIFSGIGNPQGFENSVTGLGINIVKSIRFTDHHNYTQADIDKIIDEALRMNADAVITTHKDAVKISELQVKGAGILALNIKLKITKNETEFNRRLLKLCSL